jgi:polyhydroxyalkanoate synthesis regulator protein
MGPRQERHPGQKDITTATMAQLIFEEEKRSPRLPVEELYRIIRNGLPAWQSV